jgi:isocitrate dehydrogenase
MKFTEGMFKVWGYEMAENEFGDKVFTGQCTTGLLQHRGICAEEAMKML